MVLVANQFLAAAAVWTWALSQPQSRAVWKMVPLINRPRAGQDPRGWHHAHFFHIGGNPAETAAAKVPMFEKVLSADQGVFTAFAMEYWINLLFLQHLFTQHKLPPLFRAAQQRCLHVWYVCVCVCVCARGRGNYSRGPARLARLNCLAQSVDPNNLVNCPFQMCLLSLYLWPYCLTIPFKCVSCLSISGLTVSQSSTS